MQMGINGENTTTTTTGPNPVLNLQPESSKNRRVVLFPAPLQGHINPMLQIGNILHAKGFTISFFHTNFNSPSYSDYPHFHFQPIPDGLSENEASKADFNRSIELMMRFNESCLEPFRDCMGKLVADCGERVVCLITDVIWPFAQGVAESFNLPRLVLRADSQLIVPAEELPPIKVKDMPMIVSQNREAFSKFIANMNKEAEKAAGYIWNSLKELEHPALAKYQPTFSVPTFLIGPMHKYFPASSGSLLAQDRSCISWLDQQSPNSVLYVSFGSMAAMDEAELLETAWGLANSMQPFLWVVRPGLVRSAEWIESLPKEFFDMVGKRGLVIKWAPQQEVLAHPATGGYWTHNGWNSTLESICEGVPMICSPYFGDQIMSAKIVESYWKIGIQLKHGLERGEIEKEIKRLMVDKEGEEMRKSALGLKEKTHLCLKEGGSSFQALKNLVNFLVSV